MAKETTETKKTKAADPWERVPYKLPLTRETKTDKFHFASVNDYTCTIERGKEVAIPRCVAAMLDQQQADEYEAFMEAERLQNEYEEAVRGRR